MADLKYTVDIDTRGAKSSLNGLKGTIAGVGASIASAFTFKEIATISARFQDLRSTLGVLYKDAATGAKAFDQIKKFATQSVLGVEELTESVIKLKAAGLEPSIQQLEMFGKVAAITTDKVGTLQAITDLYARSSQGGLGLEDLDRLADRGVGVYKILNDELGITRDRVSEVGRSAEGAQLILSTLEDAFNKIDDPNLNTLSVSFSNLQIAIKNAADAIGQGGFTDALANAVNRVTEFIVANEELPKSIGAGLGAAITLAVENLKYLAAAIAAVFTAAAVGRIVAIGLAVAELAKGFRDAAIAGTVLQGVTGVGLLKVGAGLAAAAGTVALIEEMTAGASENTGELAEAMEKLSKIEAPGPLDFGEPPKIPQDTVDRAGQLGAILNNTAKSAKELNAEMKVLTSTTDNLIDDLQSSTRDMKFEFEKLNMTPLQKDIAEIERDIRTRVSKQIQKLEAAMTPENAAEITKQIQMLKDASAQAIEEQSRLARESYEHQRTFSYGWSKAFEQYKEDATNAATAAEDIFKTTTQGIEDAIVEFAKTGKFSLKSLGEELGEQLLRGGIRDIVSSIGGGQQQRSSGGNIFGNIGNIFGGLFPQQQQQSSGGFFDSIIGGAKKLFGGFFANGGYLPAGQFGIVGERGPEMIMGPASITPGARGGSMNVTINAVDAPSFQALVASDPEFIYSVAQRGSRSFV